MKSPLSISNSNTAHGRFLAHAVLFLAAIVGGQALIYHRSGGDAENLSAPIRTAQRVRREGTSAVYFGDSVVTDTEIGQETDTIPHLLQAFIPGTTITTLSSGGYGPEVFSGYVQYLLKSDRPPKLWIIPINLRSFSTGWDQKPEYQFRKEGILLRHDTLLFRIFFRPLQVFKAFEMAPIKEEEYEKTVVMDGDHAVGHVKDFFQPEGRPASEEAIARMFVYDYMYRLQPEHRKVRELVSLCQTLKNRSLQPVIYVTPVDFQTATHYLGARFKERIAENISVISKELSNAGCTPLDLSTTVEADAFNWRIVKYPNEHLHRKGRDIVAKHLAPLLQEIPLN